MKSYIVLSLESGKIYWSQMYRKNGELRLDYIEQLVNIREIRQMITEEYIEDDYELSLVVINHYKLFRIKAKYIDKYRKFDENFYSRKAIQNEEKIFQVKMLLAREFQNNAKEFLHYKQRLENAVCEELDLKSSEDIDFIKDYYLHKN